MSRRSTSSWRSGTVSALRRAFLLASTLLVSAVLLAGCGGGGGSATTAGPTTATDGGGAQSGAYQGGFEICSGGTVEEIANLYGVAEATAEAVADVIAEAVSGGTPADAADAKQGCLDAFAQHK